MAVELPRRSLTRFFIPLVDVMMLLFSIFLLLPIMEEAQNGSTPSVNVSLEEWTQLNQDLKEEKMAVEKLREKLLKVNHDYHSLRRDTVKNLSKAIDVRVLEIDGKTGELVFFDRRGDAPKKVIIDNPDKAQKLIEQMKKEAQPREVYCILMSPREVGSPFPLTGDFEKFSKWFRDVPHDLDRPPVK